MTSNKYLVRNDSPAEPEAPQKALLLGWERDKTAVVFMIGGITLLSVLAGVLVGLLVHDASLGIGATSGLAAVLSCVEVLVIWQSR
jgi:hypothetical protein